MISVCVGTACNTTLSAETEDASCCPTRSCSHQQLQPHPVVVPQIPNRFQLLRTSPGLRDAHLTLVSGVRKTRETPRERFVSLIWPPNIPKRMGNVAHSRLVVGNIRDFLLRELPKNPFYPVASHANKGCWVPSASIRGCRLSQNK